MNPSLRFFVLFIISCYIATSGFANEPELQEGPCNKLLDACKAYIKDHKEKKSLYRDCMNPALNNEKIEGLKISQEDLMACKAKKAELRQKK